jgi:hypothetical protein
MSLGVLAMLEAVHASMNFGASLTPFCMSEDRLPVAAITREFSSLEVCS